MIKAVFFDIDGTLIDPANKKMPDSTYKALKKLQQNGIKVFVATGRSPNNLDIIKDCFDFDGYLCCNGQYCFNNQEIIHEKYIEQSDIHSLLPYINQNKIPVLFAEIEQCYSNIHNYKIDQSAKYLNEPRYPVKEAKEIINQRIIQIMAYIDEAADEHLLSYLPHCKSVRWTDMFADIIPIDGGKNKGIDQMLKYYHINIDEVMAFGDGGNDIEMLKHVKIGVAMGNASQKVKAAGDFVTKAVDQDGIEYALKKYNLI